MKKQFFLLLLLVNVVLSANAQQKIISSTRLDEIKLTMPLDTVNKILGTKITVRDSQYEFSTDTIWTVYKNDSARFVFDRIVNEKKQVNCTVQNIYSASRSLKTKSGIAYGGNKFDIIKKLDGSTMRVAPDWFFENAPDKKSRSSVVLYDYSNYSIMIFHFYNNQLYAFECAYTPDAE